MYVGVCVCAGVKGGAGNKCSCIILILRARRRHSFLEASNCSVCSPNSPLSFSNYTHTHTHITHNTHHTHISHVYIHPHAHITHMHTYYTQDTYYTHTYYTHTLHTRTHTCMQYAHSSTHDNISTQIEAYVHTYLSVVLTGFASCLVTLGLFLLIARLPLRDLFVNLLLLLLQ